MLQLMCHSLRGKRVQFCDKRVQTGRLVCWIKALHNWERWRSVWLSCQCRWRLRRYSGGDVAPIEFGILGSRLPRTRRDLFEREIVAPFGIEILEACHRIRRRYPSWQGTSRNGFSTNVEAGSAVYVYDVGICSPRPREVEERDFRFVGQLWRRPVCVRDR